MEAILLCRVSTEEQRIAGNSLPAQETRLVEYCKRNNIKVKKVFSFDESAYKKERGEFEKVVEYTKEHASPNLILCVDKVDRLSRDIFDRRVESLYMLAISGQLELHFVSDGQTLSIRSSAGEKFTFQMQLGLSKYYSDAISDNVKRAIEKKIRNGEWPSKAPLGYLNVEINGKKEIVIDPERAPYIKKAFELYATGNYSVKTLLQKLTAEGLTSTNGNKLVQSVLYHYLCHKFYMGVMTWNGKDYPHNYPPLISKTLFYQVQEQMQSFNRKKIKYGAKPFIFRGAIQCENCGGTITGEIVKGKYRYYSCYNPKGICKRLYVPEEKLLDKVETDLRSLILPEDKKQAILEVVNATAKEDNVYRQHNINKFQGDLKLAKERQEKLVDFLLDGKINEEQYNTKLEHLNKQVSFLEGKIEEFTQSEVRTIYSIEELLELASKASELFKSSDINEKRQLLNILYQNCLLSGKKPLFTMQTPFQILTECASQPIELQWLDGFGTDLVMYSQAIQSLQIKPLD